MSTPTFATDIKPMFTPAQVQCMAGFDVHLHDYLYMSNANGDVKYVDHANARHVYARLMGDEKPRMPKGGPFWTEAMLAQYNNWMSGGFLP